MSSLAFMNCVNRRSLGRPRVYPAKSSEEKDIVENIVTWKLINVYHLSTLIKVALAIQCK